MSSSHAIAPQGTGEEPIPVLRETFPLKLWHGLRDPLGFLSRLHRQFGDIVILRQNRSCAVFHPTLIQHVLQENHRNYQKGPKYRAALAPLMGKGLFTSEGSFWHRQRRLVQPAFEHARLDELATPAVKCVEETLARWHQKMSRGEPVALRQELTELTVRMVLQNLFGTEAHEQLGSLIPAINEVNNQIRFAKAFLPFHLPKWIPTPAKARFQHALRVIDDFVYGAVRDRREKSSSELDVLGRLLSATLPETGEHMDDVQLRDELVTLMNAGHDTLTDAITWTLVLLAQHPEYVARARNEVAEALRDGVLGPEALKAMPLLGRIFHESLRLYPPGWAFARTAVDSDRLGQYSIPAGMLVVMSPYVVQRSPRYWDNPDQFDPDRFLPERAGARLKFAYFPFSGGPRMCMGAGLAGLEAPLILAAILQRFDFSLAEPAKPVAADPRISLRPKGTVWLRLRPACA